jgi:hypothetical protein
MPFPFVTRLFDGALSAAAALRARDLDGFTGGTGMSLRSFGLLQRAILQVIVERAVRFPVPPVRL